MKRLGIVEFVMSAGGVERVLRGLAGAFLAIPEARDWEITFLLGRYNSAKQRCEWPRELTGPNLRVEWFGEEHAVGRLFDSIMARQGIWKNRYSGALGAIAVGVLRNRLPRTWREYVGDARVLIERASRRFDVLYFTYPVGLKAPAGIRCPVVATPQDFNYLHFHAEGSPAREWLESTTVSWMERADRLLLSSEAVQQELLGVYPRFASKADVVRLGVTLDARVPSHDEIEEVRRERSLPAEFILVPGWVAPHKNQLLVVDAVRILRDGGTRIPVVFVGPHTAEIVGNSTSANPYAERVRLALQRAQLAPGRDFRALGYVSDAEIRCLYRLATVCVIPSLYEGFGLPALESRHAGCPTLVSAIPPFEEQTRALGGREPSFDPRDAGALASRIREVLAHRAEFVEGTRRAAERIPAVYDWNSTARAYLAAFDEVLESRRRGAAPETRAAQAPPSGS